jgi:predicted amidophosphoribosyltransferase
MDDLDYSGAWPKRALRTDSIVVFADYRAHYDETILAVIFGRVLIGFLTQEQDIFRTFDLIVASPTYVGVGARAWDHTRRVLKRAHELSDGTWPFDVEEQAAIIETAATERLTRKSWTQRHAITTGPLRAALTIPQPARTCGKRVLVYDDVFTDGQTLNEVARCLRVAGGAAAVCGVTLWRQPYPRKAAPGAHRSYGCARPLCSDVDSRRPFVARGSGWEPEHVIARRRTP